VSIYSDRLWTAIGVSTQGSSHEVTGLPCQDAHASLDLGGGWFAAAVADGAGSAAKADIGAITSVRASLEHVAACVPYARSAESLWNDLARDVVLYTREAVEQQAELLGVHYREFASTLIVVLAGPEVVLGLQIGDGCSVVSDAAGELHSLTLPPPSEFVNETVFLTSRNPTDSLKLATKQGEFRHFALMSDGLQPLAMQSDETPHPAFFRPMFEFAEAELPDAEDELTRFLRSPRVRERADDDLTLVIGYRRRGAV
jgi:hypothetical protein